MIFICVYLNMRNMPECRTMILNALNNRLLYYPINIILKQFPQKYAFLCQFNIMLIFIIT